MLDLWRGLQAGLAVTESLILEWGGRCGRDDTAGAASGRKAPDDCRCRPRPARPGFVASARRRRPPASRLGRRRHCRNTASLAPKRESLSLAWQRESNQRRRPPRTAPYGHPVVREVLSTRWSTDALCWLRVRLRSQCPASTLCLGAPRSATRSWCSPPGRHPGAHTAC